MAVETGEIRSFGFSEPTRIDVRPASPIAAGAGPRTAFGAASAASPDEAPRNTS